MSEQKSIHLPGLNGLRAIAAISVMLSHVFQSTFGNWGIPGMTIPIFGGGVILFFVISGFLITYLLLREYQKYQDIAVGKFYVRRILRIWPIYYLFIAICFGVLWFVGRQGEMLHSTLFYYLFFAANIPFLSSAGIPVLAHYWSIGVEEQFYLFWPWLVKLFRHRIIPAILAVMIVWIFAKYGSWIVLGSKSIIYKFFSVTCFQSMMYGALGAILFYNNHQRFLNLITHKLVQVVAWSFFILSWFLDNYIPAVMRNDIISFFSLIIVMEQVSGRGKLINLERAVFDFFGRISYGIYVIHPLMILVFSTLWMYFRPDIGLVWQYLIIYILIVLSTTLVAHLSYRYYEAPFLKLKDKFAMVKSKNSLKINKY